MRGDKTVSILVKLINKTFYEFLYNALNHTYAQKHIPKFSKI